VRGVKSSRELEACNLVMTTIAMVNYVVKCSVASISRSNTEETASQRRSIRINLANVLECEYADRSVIAGP
jgi:hypothetical protein